MPKLPGTQIPKARTLCAPRRSTQLTPHLPFLPLPGPASQRKLTLAVRWSGSCPRGLLVRKERSLPYLLAVGFLPLSGSRALCHSPQGGRRPHRTGKGPWNSPLLSLGLWGSTPWLSHSSPARPGAGRLQRKGAKREGAINTTAAASERLSLVLPLGPVKVYILQVPGLYSGLHAMEFVIK